MSTNEKLEGYFQLQDKQRLAKMREERAAQLAEKTQQERKDLHWMHCPKCGADMEVIKMEEIEIDKCTECLGLFFDHNELEQLLETEHKKNKGLFGKILGL